MTVAVKYGDGPALKDTYWHVGGRVDPWTDHILTDADLETDQDMSTPGVSIRSRR